ncbi:hypothetical protein B6U74_05930 [Candidatus Bathyarchaeota archaeon ex4484_205]|nr:MAG: hypothetical protein B6U74_05930 [Candidatus Bathyarchaeota archaeon ex4484_205]
MMPISKVPFKVTLIGVGGGGINSVTTIYDSKVPVITIAIDTDKKQLNIANAHHTILIGEKLTYGGRGTGGDMKVGEEALRNDIDIVMEHVRESDFFLLINSLGGGTGGGAGPALIDELRAEFPNSIIGSVSSIPFRHEGRVRWENASLALSRMLEKSDFVLVSLNDMLLDKFGNLPVRECFNRYDYLVAEYVKGVIDGMIPENSVKHVDFSDFKIATQKTGVSAFGVGRHHLLNSAVDDALETTFLDFDPSTVQSMLVIFRTREMVSMKDAVGSLRKLNKYGVGRLLWGMRVVSNSSRNLVIITACGTKSRTVEEMLERGGASV